MVDKKKKINILSLIRFIPFLSELFCVGFSGENPGREGVGTELYENFLGFEMICLSSVYGNNLWQLCIAGKECEMD